LIYCTVLSIRLFSFLAKKGMNMMIHFEKLAGLRIPCTAIGGNRMISIVSDDNT
jgi:hypothetical protein